MKQNRRQNTGDSPFTGAVPHRKVIVRALIDEIIEKHDLRYTNVLEERKDGKVAFITLTVRFKVE